MGIGKWIKEKYAAAKATAKEIYDGVKDFANDVVDVAKDVYAKGKELVSAVGTAVSETVQGWVRPKPKQDWSSGKPTGNSCGGNSGNNVSYGVGRSKSDTEIKAELGRRIDLIDSYQKQARKEAAVYEKMVKNAYEKKYEKILIALGKVMDTKHIQSYIKLKANIFQHQMRDEVNSSITYGNRKLKKLMNDSNLSDKDYSDKIQEYVDSVYEEAKTDLLDLLQTTFTETDSYIKVNAKKFLQDEQEVLKGLRTNMTNLSKEGEAKEQELEKIGVEYATLALIRVLAKEQI